MKKLTLYHGTSAKNARQIKKAGFVPDKHYNWSVRSKQGFVYSSTAYAPFYAMMNAQDTNKLALIKICVNEKDCYPDDDFLMQMIGKNNYTQEELDAIELEIYKSLWKDSLKRIGNIATKPNKVEILGVQYFNGKGLYLKCDPSISFINFLLMGEYYKKLSNWIYEGNEIRKFKSVR